MLLDSSLPTMSFVVVVAVVAAFASLAMTTMTTCRTKMAMTMTMPRTVTRTAEASMGQIGTLVDTCGIKAMTLRRGHKALVCQSPAKMLCDESSGNQISRAISTTSLSWWYDLYLYPVRGTRPTHGSDILWTDNVPNS